ncbi:MAG: KpsF/GutQ family sugar-phosphate isomerase [Pirellulaceae bacterium]|nr:KpsF/GutQ family sugar-phosphate isomerase [Pirellulaceae bacterium]
MSTDALSADAARPGDALSPLEQLNFARQILRIEGQAVLALAGRLPGEFCRALELLYRCEGSVIVTGMGKAGLIGQKIAATLASTGTRSHFLHPGEAVHGDLGRIHRQDVVLMLSYSGATEEVVRLLPSLADLGIAIVAITGKPASPLARQATVTLDLGPLDEACALGLAPSTSTTAMLALGDALSLVLSRMRQFGPEDFARFHPGGSLGRKLAKVDDVMRPLADCRVALQSRTVREVLVEVGRPGRRSGAVMLIDERGLLRGIFTDSDLARLLESRRDGELDRPVQQLMTREPKTVASGTRLTAAVELMAQRKLSELPVVDPFGRPIGLVDITDVVELSWPGPSPDGFSRPAAATAAAAAVEGDLPVTLPFPPRSPDQASL